MPVQSLGWLTASITWPQRRSLQQELAVSRAFIPHQVWPTSCSPTYVEQVWRITASSHHMPIQQQVDMLTVHHLSNLAACPARLLGTLHVHDCTQRVAWLAASTPIGDPMHARMHMPGSAVGYLGHLHKST